MLHSLEDKSLFLKGSKKLYLLNKNNPVKIIIPPKIVALSGISPIIINPKIVVKKGVFIVLLMEFGRNMHSMIVAKKIL